MKINYLFFFILFISCASKIERKDICIEKTEYILQAISNGNYEIVRNQYVGRKETIEKNKGGLDTLSMQIANELKRYGIPDRNKIIVIGKENLKIPKDYGEEFNGNSVEVITTKTILGNNKEYGIEMGFIIEKKKARLLRVSTYDQPQD